MRCRTRQVPAHPTEDEASKLRIAEIALSDRALIGDEFLAIDPLGRFRLGTSRCAPSGGRKVGSLAASETLLTARLQAQGPGVVLDPASFSDLSTYSRLGLDQ